MPPKDIFTDVDGQRLKLSNLEKVLYPSIGISKAQFIQYFLDIAPLILNYIELRPITMIRYPDGINGKKFYSKSKPSWTPDWIKTYIIHHESKDIDYIYVHNKASIAWLANLACLEIHPTQFKVIDDNKPDHFIFDLDPDEGMNFQMVTECAIDLKSFLETHGYTPFIKTSGGKGLHLYVPIPARWSYDIVTASVKLLAKEFVNTDLSKYTLQVSKGKRKGKILIDIYRNYLGNTCVAPYSTRGKPGAPISMPISWEHLSEVTASQQFNLINYHEYLEKHGDAWKDWRKAEALLHNKRKKKGNDKVVKNDELKLGKTDDLRKTGQESTVVDDRLVAYAQKREFDKTLEPAGDVPDLNRTDEFVLQMHDATNLHYDLRLEHKGTLWSWAIPKGLPTEQDVKRLAIRTEDHPVRYLDFEGVIPKGSYGGGTMWIIDKGKIEWKSKKVDKSLKFELNSKLVKGQYKLYRLREDQWLIEKTNTPDTTDSSLKPMLASSTKKIPSPKNHIYEVKWDGIRALIFFINDEVKIISRSGRDITSQFPEFQKPERFEVESGIFDAEIVVLDSEGIPQFHDVISRMHRKNGIGRISKKATCYLFDVTQVDGIDLTSFPFHKRREILEAVVKKGRRIRLSDLFENGQLLFDAIEAKGMEGIMAKKKDGKYLSGQRSDNWLKVKCRTNDKAYIIGYTLGKGDRSNVFGALHLAKKESDQWCYMGKVGTGFDTNTLKDIYNMLSVAPKTNKYIDDSIEEPDRTVWVEAKYRCELSYASLSSNGTYREPVFKNLIKENKS